MGGAGDRGVGFCLGSPVNLSYRHTVTLFSRLSAASRLGRSGFTVEKWKKS